jgi:chemotaxis protein MotB
MSLTKESSGLMPTKTKDSGRGSSGKMDNAAASTVELAMLRRLQQDLAKALVKENPKEEEEETVKFNLSPEGLRINVFDRARKPVFEKDSAKLTDYGVWILTTLAWEISRYKTFSVELEGHTQKGMQAISDNYGSWELSTDRANAGRRKLLEFGVTQAQIRKVAGFSDTVPLPDVAPEDSINRRITLLLRIKPEDQR